MAGTSVLKLKVDDKEYNSSLRQAQQGMQHLEQALQASGKTFNQVDKSVVEYARGIGKMEAQSKTARGRIGEMTSAFVELSTQYNKMSADVQKSDLGQALSKSIGQLRQRTIAAKQELEDLNRQLSNTKAPDIGASSGGFLSGLGDKMGGALQVFGGNLMTKGAGMLAGLASEMGDMVKQGVELAKQGEGIRIAFERLGRGDILDGLRQATHGTVTDIELMKAAVKFNDFKLPLDELGTMLAFAQQKAKDTGQSVDYMVDSIVTGLGRKSLMILDNLGLSATEVKERMAETGDMTKAVGAIIREQMAKAGDYVETAADRAAQANVSLQNKMEELGRKFAPLQEASNSLWTSMKIGILDVVGGPLTDLLNNLTQAGRMANAYGLMGGNAKVGRMTANLANAREGNRQSLYQRQQQEIWRYINRRENALKERDRWFKDMGNKELGEHLSREYKAFGTADRGEIQAQIDAAKKVLADYKQAAKKILQPIKQEIESTDTDTKSGAGGKGGKTEVEAAIGSIDYQTKKVQELQKAWRAAADDDSREKIKKEIEEQQYVLDRMTGKEKFDPSKILPIADLTGRVPTPDFTAGTAPVAPNTIKFSDGLQKFMDYFEKQQVENYKNRGNETIKALEKFNSDFSKISGGVSSIVSGIQQMGIEIPKEIQSVFGVLSGISSIMTGVTSILSLILVADQITAGATATKAIPLIGWGLAGGGIVPHFAGGGLIGKAALGMTIPGNSYSGDLLRLPVDGGRGMIGVNSGEVILNQAQAGILESELSGSRMRDIHVTGELQGEKIYLAINRHLRRTGQGELVTWG